MADAEGLLVRLDASVGVAVVGKVDDQRESCLLGRPDDGIEELQAVWPRVDDGANAGQILVPDRSWRRDRRHVVEAPNSQVLTPRLGHVSIVHQGAQPVAIGPRIVFDLTFDIEAIADGPRKSSPLRRNLRPAPPRQD